MLTYTGILKVKGKETKVSDRFKKREFVLSDNSTSYPQTILFQLTQDRCPLIENVNVGDEVTVHFQLKGREWTNPKGEVKVFNSLDVFKVENPMFRNVQKITFKTFRLNLPCPLLAKEGKICSSPWQGEVRWG